MLSMRYFFPIPSRYRRKRIMEVRCDAASRADIIALLGIYGRVAVNGIIFRRCII